MSERKVQSMYGSGKTARFMLETQLRLGAHIHTNRSDGSQFCEGGDPECSLFGIQLMEALEVWK